MALDKLIKKLDEVNDTFKYYKDEIANKNTTGERVGPPLNALFDVAALTHSHIVKLGISFQPPISTEAAILTLDDVIKMGPNIAAIYCGMTNEKDSKVMCDEFKSRLVSFFNETVALIDELKMAVERQKKNLTGKKSSESTLACINKVLHQCNNLKELKALGPSGVASQKLASDQNMIKDGINELDEWIKDPNGDDGFGFSDDDDFSDEEGDKEPHDDNDNEVSEEDIELAKDWSKRLVKLEYLLKAIRQRRLKLLSVSILDKVASEANTMCASIDDLVSSFQMSETNTNTMDEIKSSSKRLLDLVHVEDTDDQFSKWVQLFNQHFF